MISRRFLLAVASTAALAAALSTAYAQQTQRNDQSNRQPQASQGPNSGTMQRADRDMRAVLEKLQGLGAQPIGTQSVEQTRQGPTPADAVKAVMRDRGMDPDRAMAEMRIRKRDMQYPVGGGQGQTSQLIRIYTPEGQAPQGGWPMIVYYHGGGWVIATVDTYEASAMALARKARAIVASVEYRKGPENRFPAAHDDAIAAYRWAVTNAQELGANRERVAVAGESAGANLALNVAINARDGNITRPDHMLLVYPVAGVSMETPSYRENAEAMPLSRRGMEFFVQNATNGASDLQDPRLDLVGKANLRGLPPATVITAEIDPLRSEGQELARKLREAGVRVTARNYDGVTHEFFGMAPVVAKAEAAQNLAARNLREAMAGTVTGTVNRRER